MQGFAYLVAAYAIPWAGLFAYLAVVMLRIRGLRTELAAVEAFWRDVVAQPRPIAICTAVAWLISWHVALLLREIFVDPAIPPLTFAIVVLRFNLLILEVWRWPFALINSLRKGGVEFNSDFIR